MQKIKRFFDNWSLLVIFVFVWLACLCLLLCLNYDANKNLLVNILGSWDTAASIALSVLAFLGYIKYSKQKHRESKLLDILEQIQNAGQNGNDGAIIVHAGGSNQNAINEAVNFFKEIKLKEELILSKKFGDEHNRVSKKDMALVVDWLQNECMKKLAYVDKVHVIVIGVGIAFAVVTDILKNWKPTMFYHNQDGYQLWYVDIKSKDKLTASNPLDDEKI